MVEVLGSGVRQAWALMKDLPLTLLSPSPVKWGHLIVSPHSADIGLNKRTHMPGNGNHSIRGSYDHYCKPTIEVDTANYRP